MMVTKPEFAELVGCLPKDIGYLVSTKRLVVDGDRIDSRLSWLALKKLQSAGFMDDQGKLVPLKQRPKKRMAAGPRTKRRRDDDD